MDRKLLVYLDGEYEIDLGVLRREFAKVDTGDPASLRRWFEDYPYLSASDCARLANVTRKAVYNWKRRASIAPAVTVKTPRYTFSKPTPVAPGNWHDLDCTWLED